MPTVTAGLLGTYRSKVSATPLSSAAGSVDILTVVHLLGTVPDEVRAITRSVATQGQSTFVGSPVVVSYNGSQAVINLPAAGAGNQNILLDVICEFTTTPNR